MGLISNIATTIDVTLVNYVQQVFTGVATPIYQLLKVLALAALMFMALNQIVQFRSVNYSQYLHWAIRYILIYSFAIIWANFSAIYNLFIAIPGDYSALMLKAVALGMYQSSRPDLIDPTLIHDTYSAMDEFGHAIIWIANDFFKEATIFDIANAIKNTLTGVLVVIIGGIFLGASAILVIASKVGFAIAVSLAPLAIVLLMTEQTKHHFDSWMRLTASFVVIPLLTSAMMTIVLYVASQMLFQSSPSSFDKSTYFGFLFTMIAAIYLLFQLPTMASTLASASVAVAGAGAARAMMLMTMGAPGKVMLGAQTIYRGSQLVRHTAGAANAARKAGAGPAGIARATLSGMRQSSVVRREQRDRRLADRIPSPGQSAPALKRYQQSLMGQSAKSGGGLSGPSNGTANHSSSGGGSSGTNPLPGSKSGGASPRSHAGGYSQNSSPNARYREAGSNNSSSADPSDDQW